MKLRCKNRLHIVLKQEVLKQEPDPGACFIFYTLENKLGS